MADEFIRKLARLRELDAADSAALRSRFQRVKSVQKGKALFTQGEPLDDIYIVKSGWYFSYVILADGSRQIDEIFTKGDIIGLENLGWSEAMTSISCTVGGELYAASLAQVRTLLHRHPKLDHVFRTLQMIQNILRVDRLTAISRLDAFNRIAFFLSDTFARQKLNTDNPSSILKLPLSQGLIADCLGLSSVHVSRQYGKLVEQGLISKIDRKTVSILDVERLNAEGHYTDRFATLFKTALPPLDRDAQNDGPLFPSTIIVDTPHDNRI